MEDSNYGIQGQEVDKRIKHKQLRRKFYYSIHHLEKYFETLSINRIYSSTTST